MSDQFDFEAARTEFGDYLLNEKTEEALTLARGALDQGVTPVEFFESCVTPTMEEIGRQFEELEIFLPEMVVAAEIVQQMNDEIITPAIESGSVEHVESVGNVVLATVQGDLHDIGKSMVALMLRVNGFQVTDMGTDVSPSDIVSQAQQEQADIIGLSSLLTTCLPYMKDVVDYLEGKGIRQEFAVIVGGAAPTDEFAAEIGVDGHGDTAADAVTICKDIMQTRVKN